MTSRKLCVLAWLIGSLALMPWYTVKATSAAEALLVVAGAKFPVTDIPYASLKSAFRGQRVSVGGVNVVPINHPFESPMRTDFDRIILGLEPLAVSRFWVDMRIRDQGKPPTTASTPELALRIVAALQGAVSYTNKAGVTGKLALKVLTVDGKAAGDSGYAFSP